MGGLGSGRPTGSGQRLAVEDCRSLDVNCLRRHGVLTNGWSGGWHWRRNNKSVASISVIGGRERILLMYRCRLRGEDWEEVNEPIPIRWRACRFGGERPFFSCPGVVNGKACGRAVLKLYSASRFYFCRHCYRLTYSSRSEDSVDRALRRANRIRHKLGGEPGLASMFPNKPKGMWRRTYNLLLDETVGLESRSDERLLRYAARLSADRNLRKGPKRRQVKGYWK